MNNIEVGLLVWILFGILTSTIFKFISSEIRGIIEETIGDVIGDKSFINKINMDYIINILCVVVFIFSPFIVLCLITSMLAGGNKK